MRRTAIHRLYAVLLLLILGSAHVGQKVHIFTENPEHFAAYWQDRVPDNGATSRVVERCVVDDYSFFPFLDTSLPPHGFYFAVLALIRPAATHCRRCPALRSAPLRAPPRV